MMCSPFVARQSPFLYGTMRRTESASLTWYTRMPRTTCSTRALFFCREGWYDAIDGKWSLCGLDVYAARTQALETVPRMAPTSAVSPSPTRIEASVPLTGERTSTVASSVSIVRRASSTSTLSPIRFKHSMTVTSFAIRLVLWVPQLSFPSLHPSTVATDAPNSMRNWQENTGPLFRRSLVKGEAFAFGLCRHRSAFSFFVLWAL